MQGASFQGEGLPAAPPIRPAPVSPRVFSTRRISPFENHLDLWPILQHLDQLTVHAGPFSAHDEHRFPVCQETIRTVPADRRSHSRIIRWFRRAQVLSTPSTHSLHDPLLYLVTRGQVPNPCFPASQKTGLPLQHHATLVPECQGHSIRQRTSGTRATCGGENQDVTGFPKKWRAGGNPK